MGVKFGMEEGTFGPLLHGKFHPHRCNVSPLRGEKPQNWPLSKLNTGRFALCAMLPVTRISCHWQTRTACCITANVLQTNKVGAQCDKLATKLSWQCFTSKVANFQLPHLYLAYPTCIWRLCWGDHVWVLLSLWAIVTLFAWSYV